VGKPADEYSQKRPARMEVLNPMFVMCMLRDRIIKEDFGQLKDVGAFITKNLGELGRIAHDAWALSRFVDFEPTPAAANATNATPATNATHATPAVLTGGTEAGRLYVMPVDEVHIAAKLTVAAFLKNEVRIRQLRAFEDLPAEMDATKMTAFKEGGTALPGNTNALDYASTIMAIHAFRKLTLGYLCAPGAGGSGKVGVGVTCEKSSVEVMKDKGIGAAGVHGGGEACGEY